MNPVELKRLITIAVRDAVANAGAPIGTKRDRAVEAATSKLVTTLTTRTEAPADAETEDYKRGYREGWNDREDDLIAGVGRIYPADHGAGVCQGSAANTAQGNPATEADLPSKPPAESESQ